VARSPDFSIDFRRAIGILDAAPKNQFYNPPENAILATNILRKTPDARVELHTYRYTKVGVRLRKGNDGKLMKMPLSGGPFTIGRVIHGARSVGFTGWTGCVAVSTSRIPATPMLGST
jgi:hypothetical protein